MKKFLFSLLFAIGSLSIGVGANAKISPAIDVIAWEHSMVKSGVLYQGEILFNTDDFDEALGMNVESITLCSLPKEEDGKLMLENLYLVENQIVFREDFSSLRFVSAKTEESVATFTFEPNDCDYQIECSLKSTKAVNFSPVSSAGSAVSAWTQTNVSCIQTLNGYDPEGDSLQYEITSYPKKGLVCFLDDAEGSYQYTPYKDAKGIDAFSYRVRDSYGNYSSECEVSVRIEKLKTTYVFSDVSTEYENAASVMVLNDYMTFEEQEDGTLCFHPGDQIKKDEFIFLLMNVMGAKNVPTVKETRFADDAEIEDKYKGYFECAYTLGILKTERKADGIYVNPKSNISIAEASYTIQKIIGCKDNLDFPTFNDSEIPSYAKESLLSLVQLGIIDRSEIKGSTEQPLTKAQTARILMSLLEYRGKLSK